MTFAVLRESVYSDAPPEHITTRHDIIGVRGTLNDLDVSADHFVGLGQMRIGERLVSAVTADGFRYIIERDN